MNLHEEKIGLLICGNLCSVDVPDDKVGILSSDDNINVEADGEVKTQ